MGKLKKTVLDALKIKKGIKKIYESGCTQIA